MSEILLNNYNYSSGDLNSTFDAYFLQIGIDLNVNPEVWFFLGVKFVKAPTGSYVNPFSGTYNANDWPDADWVKFKDTIIKNSNKFWDGKFWIITMGDRVYPRYLGKSKTSF